MMEKDQQLTVTISSKNDTKFGDLLKNNLKKALEIAPSLVKNVSKKPTLHERFALLLQSKPPSQLCYSTFQKDNKSPPKFKHKLWPRRVRFASLNKVQKDDDSSTPAVHAGLQLGREISSQEPRLPTDQNNNVPTQDVRLNTSRRRVTEDKKKTQVPSKFTSSKRHVPQVNETKIKLRSKTKHKTSSIPSESFPLDILLPQQQALQISAAAPGSSTSTTRQNNPSTHLEVTNVLDKPQDIVPYANEEEQVAKIGPLSDEDEDLSEECGTRNPLDANENVNLDHVDDKDDVPILSHKSCQQDSISVPKLKIKLPKTLPTSAIDLSPVPSPFLAASERFEQSISNHDVEGTLQGQEPQTDGSLLPSQTLSSFIPLKTDAGKSKNILGKMLHQVRECVDKSSNNVKYEPHTANYFKPDRNHTDKIKKTRPDTVGKFHGRTLLYGKEVPPRYIPLDPIYKSRPIKKNGEKEVVPLDPRPMHYAQKKRKKKQKQEVPVQSKRPENESEVKGQLLKKDSRSHKISIKNKQQVERKISTKPLPSKEPKQNIWKRVPSWIKNDDKNIDSDFIQMEVNPPLPQDSPKCFPVDPELPGLRDMITNDDMELDSTNGSPRCGTYDSKTAPYAEHSPTKVCRLDKIKLQGIKAMGNSEGQKQDSAAAVRKDATLHGPVLVSVEKSVKARHLPEPAKPGQKRKNTCSESSVIHKSKMHCGDSDARKKNIKGSTPCEVDGSDRESVMDTDDSTSQKEVWQLLDELATLKKIESQKKQMSNLVSLSIAEKHCPSSDSEPDKNTISKDAYKCGVEHAGVTDSASTSSLLFNHGITSGGTKNITDSVQLPHFYNDTLDTDEKDKNENYSSRNASDETKQTKSASHLADSHLAVQELPPATITQVKSCQQSPLNDHTPDAKPSTYERYNTGSLSQSTKSPVTASMTETLPVFSGDNVAQISDDDSQETALTPSEFETRESDTTKFVMVRYDVNQQQTDKSNIVRIQDVRTGNSAGNVCEKSETSNLTRGTNETVSADDSECKSKGNETPCDFSAKFAAFKSQNFLDGIDVYRFKVQKNDSQYFDTCDLPTKCTKLSPITRRIVKCERLETNRNPRNCLQENISTLLKECKELSYLSDHVPKTGMQEDTCKEINHDTHQQGMNRTNLFEFLSQTIHLNQNRREISVVAPTQQARKSNCLPGVHGYETDRNIVITASADDDCESRSVSFVGKDSPGTSADKQRDGVSPSRDSDASSGKLSQRSSSSCVSFPSEHHSSVRHSVSCPKVESLIKHKRHKSCSQARKDKALSRLSRSVSSRQRHRSSCESNRLKSTSSDSSSRNSVSSRCSHFQWSDESSSDSHKDAFFIRDKQNYRLGMHRSNMSPLARESRPRTTKEDLGSTSRSQTARRQYSGGYHEKYGRGDWCSDTDDRFAKESHRFRDPAPSYKKDPYGKDMSNNPYQLNDEDDMYRASQSDTDMRPARRYDL